MVLLLELVYSIWRDVGVTNVSQNVDRTEKRRREQSEQKADESRNPILDDPRMKNVDERMAEVLAYLFLVRSCKQNLIVIPPRS